MSPAEMTYNALMSAPDLEKAVKGLSDFDLFAVRARLAEGNRSGWVAERVHGVCILQATARWEAMMERELRGFGDVDHGSEVGL